MQTYISDGLSTDRVYLYTYTYILYYTYGLLILKLSIFLKILMKFVNVTLRVPMCVPRVAHHKKKHNILMDMPSGVSICSHVCCASPEFSTRIRQCLGVLLLHRLSVSSIFICIWILKSLNHPS